MRLIHIYINNIPICLIISFFADGHGHLHMQLSINQGFLPTPDLIFMKKQKYEPIFAVIEGKSYELSQREYESMQYFRECRAIDNPGTTVFEIKQKEVVSAKMWAIVVQVLQQMKENWPNVPKVSSGCAQDYIGGYLANKFQQMGVKQVQNLYRTVHFLKISKFKKCIAAYFACMVYQSDQIMDYERLLAKFKVQQLTIEQQKLYRLTFPFLND